MKKECPLCGNFFAKEQIILHFQKEHNGRKGVKRANHQLGVYKPKPKVTKIPCPYCKKDIAEEHLKIHIREFHTKEYELDNPITAKQAFERSINPDKKIYSEDMLDSWAIKSGGGFGVGKGKK